MKKFWDSFTDNFGTTIIHPQFLLRRHIRTAFLEVKKHARGKLVDIGCGRMPYRKELEPLIEKYTGVDHPKISKLYNPSQKPDVLADAKKLPFKNNTFDIGLMLQVLEYIDEPKKVIKEAARVLKKNGVFILTSPFMYPIHDPQYDKARYTQRALKQFLKESGFKITKLETQGGFIDFWFLSLNVFLFKTLNDSFLNKQSLFHRNKKSYLLLLAIPTIIPLLFVAVLINLLAIILKKIFSILPKHTNYFPLNYLIVARRI